MPNYNENCPPNSLLYIDVNNLYGYGMLLKLSIGNFQWIPDSDLKKFTTNYILSSNDNDVIEY